MDIAFSAGSIYPRSVIRQGDTTFFLIYLHETGERRLGIAGEAVGFSEGSESEGVRLYPLTAANAAALRDRLPWLRPRPLGLQSSFGFGDRIGLATPGHVQALRAADPAGSMAPIFAQQSVRENDRTGRTPQGVMDDALWGVFQEGWQAPWGADADHIKATADLPPFLAAGYTFFTVDPSDHVDNDAQRDSLDVLADKTAGLPWNILDSSYADMLDRYCSGPVQLDGLTLEFDEAILSRALAKYGQALAHTVTIAAALSGTHCDLEMSVDETDTPTSVHEHYFIANELTRCALPLVSLAPRFVGKFQKGVDYVGDLAEFEAALVRHVAIVRHFDSYKLSIHTGSDKFSLYPIIARHTGGCVHVKTAGTSYLEALRVVASADPTLFRTLLDLGHERFGADRKTYFLDCQPERVPDSADLADADLPALLDEFHARQLLHVTFGSALSACGKEISDLLAQHEADYAACLTAHFAGHIDPFVQVPA